MKKVSIIFIGFILVMSVFGNALATTPEQPVSEQPTQPVAEQTQPEEQAGEVNQEAQLIERQEKITDTTGRVIDVKEVREVVTGTVTDKVQQVTIEIIEGPYIGEEFTTDYT